MKLVYLYLSLFNSGGTERVLHNKVCSLIRRGGYEITIITTDQGSKPNFFVFPTSVNLIDLGINYSSINTRNPFRRFIQTYKKKRLHLKRLSDQLNKIKPDITITVYPSIAVPLSKIKDGSKKIIEFHSNRYFRLNQGYRGIHQIVAKYRTWQDYQFIKKFDGLVVLTKEGAKQWQGISNVRVIPNTAPSQQIVLNDLPSSKERRVIAVGRLVWEKGYDRLIQAWSLLPKEILAEWELVIFGAGEQKNNLENLIKKQNVSSSVSIKKPTKQIFNEYAKSSFFVMTSRSEGFGMVLVEAMSCGLPAISFDFSCGPKEIIENGVNGFLVDDGNIQDFAARMEQLICNDSLRSSFSKKAQLVIDKYSEEKIMQKWVTFFAELAPPSST